jgi:hypothetical protein
LQGIADGSNCVFRQSQSTCRSLQPGAHSAWPVRRASCDGVLLRIFVRLSRASKDRIWSGDRCASPALAVANVGNADRNATTARAKAGRKYRYYVCKAPRQNGWRYREFQFSHGRRLKVIPDEIRFSGNHSAAAEYEHENYRCYHSNSHSFTCRTGWGE